MKCSVLVLACVVAPAFGRRSQMIKMEKSAVKSHQRATNSAPIEKRISWWVEANGRGVDDLLKNWAEVVDGAYIFGSGQFFDNGTMTLPDINTTGLQPFFERSIPVMPTFGGEDLPLKSWDNREALADQIVEWVLNSNFSGIHNDWESHGDEGVDAYYFYDFWRSVGQKLHAHGKKVGTCIETAPANVSHPWTPRTLSNDTIWHSYMFNWDYVLSLDYMDFVTNMATYPMMHTTDGDNSWCAEFDNKTWCHDGCEDFVDHLTPAYKFMNQQECDPHRHTVAKWCGMKGQVQDMIDAGTDIPSGQLSPGVWMNNCHISTAHPDGVTAQGWTKKSWVEFLSYLDSVGVRSMDMWTSLLDPREMQTCEWFLPEMKKWRLNGK